jgi:hypothetical protein
LRSSSQELRQFYVARTFPTETVSTNYAKTARARAN